MTDIVERLCRTLSDLPGDDDDLFNEIHSQREEAAKEIKRLRAGFCAELVELQRENERLRNNITTLIESVVLASKGSLALAKECERLREALRPFSEAATILDKEYPHQMKPDTSCNIRFAAQVAARAALAKQEEKS